MSSDPGRETERPSNSFTRGSRAEGASAVPVSTAFDVLAAETRRQVLYYLTDVAAESATTSEVADHLCSVLRDADQTSREDVLIGLHHRHLPRLEAAGIVEYEGRDGAIRYLGDPFVEECLAIVASWEHGRQP